MDDNEKGIRFPPLNESNYSEWSMRMESELVWKGLWDVVFCDITSQGRDPGEVLAETEKWKGRRSAKRMAEARAEMILRADRSQLVHMRDRDPLMVWDTLTRVHRARGLATRLALRRKFLTATKGEGETMLAYVGRVQAMAFELECINVGVTEEDRILALTMGLDVSYESFVISLDGTPTENLKVEYVISRMLNEETRRTNMEGLTGRTGDDLGSVVMYAADRKPGRRRVEGGDTGRPRRCYCCGEEGHIRAQCKKKAGMLGKQESADVAHYVTGGTYQSTPSDDEGDLSL